MHDWMTRGREVLDIEVEGLHSVRDRLGPSFTEAVEMLASCPGRVAITGIGKSGLVGRKMAATFSSTGTPAFFLHPVEGAHGDLGLIREGDVVIAISYSGNTEELNAILPALKSLGARVIAITGGADSALAHLAHVVIDAHIPREACPMNLAPTSSTTATLALGDALAVCLMDKKGFSARDFRRYHPGGSLGQRLRLFVADIMHMEDIPVVDAKEPFARALEVLDKGGLGAVVVTEDEGRLAGIITDGDVRRLVCRGGLTADKTAGDLMTRNPRRALPEHNAAEVMDMMEEKRITVLPVADEGGKLLGMVHLHDLLGKGQVKFAS